MFKNRAVIIVALISLGTLACGDDESTSENNSNTNNTNSSNNGTTIPTETLEVIGEWSTNFGSDENITAETWGSYQEVVDFDNVANIAITQNFEDADFDPGLFNRIVWTDIQNDEFHYCTVAFGLASEEEAQNSDAMADATDLDGEGCGGFSWTKMTRK